MSETKKQKVIIGVESKLSPDELAFFSLRFDVEQIEFESLLKKRPSKGVDFLYFSGGADVNPALYGQKKGKFTFIDEKRDEICQNIVNGYPGTPKLGICRGAQFLTVMAGGRLIQHIEGHTSSHKIDVHFEGNSKPSTYDITSTHHQMMYPFNIGADRYSLIGWATMFRSMVYLDGNDNQISVPEKFVEPEIIYYRQTRSLAIQGHPEYSNCNNNTKDLCLDLIETYLLR